MTSQLHLLRDHHVVHVHVGRDAPSVGERVIDHAGLLGDGELVVGEMLGEFVGGDELVPLMGTARQLNTISQAVYWTVTCSSPCIAGMVHDPEKVGVLAGATAQMENLRRACSPYNVNGIALACLPTALADQDYVRQYVGEVRSSRNRLQEEFSSLGIPFWPTQANFVLARIGPSHSDFVRGMKAHGILVRDRSSDWRCEGCVRITAGWQAHTDRLLVVVREVLQAIGRVEKTSA